MRLDIRSQTFSLTAPILVHVKRCVDFAFDRVLSHISVVEVRLADINGPRGGSDKQCGVLVQLTNGQTVVVRETDTCVYRVVDRAIARMKLLVKERLKERHHRRRSRDTIRGLQPDIGEGEVGGSDLVSVGDANGPNGVRVSG